MFKRRVNFVIALLVALLIVGAASNAQFGDNAFASDIEVTYTANFSNGLPSDWELYEKSDAAKTRAENTTNGVSITHDSATAVSPSVYYGGLYEVATDLAPVENFELKLTFKMTSFVNETRWFGILYHTQKNASNMLSAYMMNLRANGNSAQSTISTTPKFTDDSVFNVGIKPSDKKFHTVRIVCESNTVRHYLDEQLLTSYSLDSKADILGNTLNSGGFAIIVNQSAIEISLLEITGEKAVNETDLIKDERLVDTYSVNSGIVNTPTVVTEITSLSDLTALANEVRPATAILYVNDEMDVIDADGVVLGSFDTIYTTHIQGRVIPAVYVDGQEVATALSTYLKSVRFILDLAVVCPDMEILGSFREQNAAIRGIADWSGQTEMDCAEIVAQSNIAQANIIILSKTQATYGTVNYLQGRLKTVWITAEIEDDFDAVEAITKGAYGIITQDYARLYEVFEVHAEETYMVRRPFNVAHRGDCINNYENSLEGCISAFEGGATHLEIDAYLTSDNEIVIMHDSTLNRTTNGIGSVTSMTLAEIQKYLITKNTTGSTMGAGVKIPTLNDIFEYFKGQDVVIVLEIKDANAALIPKLKELLDEYEIYDQVVVISFQVSQLLAMKTGIPQIPTANLNTIHETNLADSLYLLGRNNTSVDTSSSNATPKFTRMLKDRGFMGWYWTYGNASTAIGAMMSGTSGITNNMPTAFKELAKTLIVPPFNVNNVNNIETDTAIGILTQYDRTIFQVVCSPIFVKKQSDTLYLVIYRYEFSSDNITYTLLTEPVHVTVATASVAPEDNNKSGKGCETALLGSAFAPVCATLLFISLQISRRKEKNNPDKCK